MVERKEKWLYLQSRRCKRATVGRACNLRITFPSLVFFSANCIRFFYTFVMRRAGDCLSIPRISLMPRTHRSVADRAPTICVFSTEKTFDHKIKSFPPVAFAKKERQRSKERAYESLFFLMSLLASLTTINARDSNRETHVYFATRVCTFSV
jgi:hypothetical protein